ncbi:hypothetical protein RvVAR031_37280 [Agrobacterium vitis]|nr:hypothetical protein RvVAR031_37280 [Agrobacterium vitis]
MAFAVGIYSIFNDKKNQAHGNVEGGAEPARWAATTDVCQQQLNYILELTESPCD